MIGAAFLGPHQLEIKNFPDPVAEPGGMVMKVHSNTICGTDGRILRGEKTAGMRMGCILGHEMAGEIVELGEGTTGYAVGDRVAVMPMIPCGVCIMCKRGWENLCPDAAIYGYNVDGGLAEYVNFPAAALQRGGVAKFDTSVDYTTASLSEPLSCVINGFDQYDARFGETVLIIGAGPIGLMHMFLAKTAGATTIISETSQTRRDKATELGADMVVDPSATDLKQFVLDATDGLGADVAVLAIGVPALVNQAFHCVRKRGRVSCFAGFPKGKEAGIDPNLIHYGEFTVLGASNSGRQHQIRALRLIESGKIPMDKLVTHTFPLDKVHEAINFVGTGEGIKIAVLP